MNELVAQLIDSGYLKTAALISAFKKLDRRDFVPEEFKSRAYEDRPLSIGEGQTISQPSTVAFMLELLELAPGQKVLDVGTGSGWQAGLLAEIVGPLGRVVSIERIESLSKQAGQNLLRFNLDNVELVVGDGSRGYLTEAPYDRIIAAAAGDGIPKAWQDQLKVGGVIVAPIGASLIKLVKKNEADFEEEDYPGFIFVPLIGGS